MQGTGPERLSSRWTSFYQRLFPLLCVAGSALFLWPLAGDAGGPWLWLPAAACLALTVFAFWLRATLCTVFLDHDTLIVGFRGDTHRIPLRDAEGASGTVLINPELAWVRFRRPTPLGTRVVFLPQRRSFGFSQHPVVAKLNRLILTHQAPGLPPPIEARRGRVSRGPGGGDAARAIAIGAIAFVALAVGIFAAVLSFLHGVGPQDEALAIARAHPELVAALGEPIEVGWLPMGNVRVQGEEGAADLKLSLSGPRGKASLRVRASYDAGEWRFDELIATLDDGRRIDLLEPGEPEGELL